MALVSDWTQVGADVFYRKAELFSLEWGGGLSVSDVILCGAPYGGPIALTWPHKSFQQRTGQAPSSPVIVIFSAAGCKMATIKWGSTQLIAMGWSQSEDLLCVQQDGAVSVYDMFGDYKHTFSMGQEAKDAGVLSAKVFEGLQGTGVAVITAANSLYVIANMADASPRKYSDIPVGPVLCWSVLKEERSLSMLLSQSKSLCLASVGNTRALVIQAPHMTEGIEENAVISCMAVCSNHRSVALLSSTGKLWLGSADLITRFCLHDTKSSVKPHQMAWCGTGSVVVMWEVTLQLITITGSVTTFYLDSPAHLVQEIDCVRIIGDTKHDILYKIPHVTVETLGIGSMSAGALLVEAHLGYEEESPRAYDCLTMIQGNEEEAVQQCVEAARLDLEPHNSSLLLRSAIFGRTFLPPSDPELIRETVMKLRILNNLRGSRIGLPLTYPQLERLTLPMVLERLLARRLFPVALAVANTYRLEGQLPRILAHWACYKISSTSRKSDEQLAQEIHGKLGYTPGISYTEIADCADTLNRRQLAVKLLGYECRAKEQVTGLLRLNEHSAALGRAQTTGDTDLILTVLQHVKKHMPLADFLMLVSGSPLCRAVYSSSCVAGARDALRDLCVQEDNFHGQACMRVEEAYTATRTDMRLGLLQSTAECFRRAKDDLWTQLTEDQVKLIKCQVGLEEAHQKSYVELSVTATLRQLIKDGHTKDADKIRADFKVPDKRYWHLRVMAHAEANQWQLLEAFVKSKKSPPIPMEALVDECLKHDNQTEAKKYVTRVKDENKVEYLRKCGLVAEADKLAEAAASVSPLARVMTAAPALHSLFD